jgi:hypothetical protein
MKDYFHIKEVRPQELMRILLVHFSHAQNIKGLVYRYQRQGSSCYLDFICNEDGSVKNILISKNFPQQELNQIEQKIQETLLANHGEIIGQVVGFCGEKISGYFKYKDLFQILPVPDISPKPDVGFADHPFILEVKFKKSTDFIFNNSRKMEKAIIYSRLLNQLVNQRIWLGSRYGQSAWAYHNTDDLNNLTSKWTQLGYVPKGLVGNSGQFSPIDTLKPIEREEYNKYYSFIYRSSDVFKLPDNLELSFDKVFSLDELKWKKFFMACSWFSQHSFTWQESHSSAFIELVTALECLAQEKDVCKECNQPLLESEGICKSCGQPRYHITKHFQQFLKTYVPSINNYPQAKRTIYQIRSQLAHGMDLLQADLEPWNFMMDAKQGEQRQLQSDLFFIARTAIYNWLQKA